MQPQLQRLNGAVVFTGRTGTEAPPGAEEIGITLSGVDLRNPLPQLAAQNAAFRARLTSGRIAVSELFEATAALEEAYADAGFVLTRVVLPQQSLRDGGVLRVEVVNGFIERIDTANVPANTRSRIDGLTAPIVNKKGLTRAELERQLLLAGDVPGVALKSALGAGDAPGSAVIALDPEYRPVTGFAGFGNPTDDGLGPVAFNVGMEINSPLKFGETLYLRASGAPEDFFNDDPRSRILAVGAVVPLGFTGLTLNVEFTSSDTTPDDDLVATRSSFDRQSVRLSYPFVRSRQLNVTGQMSLDLQSDEQSLILGGGALTPLYRDELTVLRFGGSVSYFHEDESVTEAGLVLSQGLDAFGARTAANATASGLPLSRAGADAEFTKLSGSFSHRRQLPASIPLALSLMGRFQTSFGDPLLTSEQISIVGAQELSAFDSGALRGDNGFVVRSELSTQSRVTLGSVPVLLSPYAFVSYGMVQLENPSAAEQGRTDAFAYGIGIDFFAQTDSNFRSSSLRVELGRGETDDGSADENRITISGNFRF
ncbi:ShlB/FhaC/HecB family hemolysin secretion/activation protein [Pseudosulfitobacter koreensis]|uniref:Hemolysin activation/secretion protein n=1 Tax=Pseudosulfitobacter koreensis TaxID=2968472 RepID=A0ABT1Z2H5_9RHOB|nr:ShlB/FhaC/HecB family hemolysin secretion/activation protein [Pseudosulfitobacter koreense]MCR8827334.1 hypothetical protein [Pseudosulfitobacter koreense]